MREEKVNDDFFILECLVVMQYWLWKIPTCMSRKILYSYPLRLLLLVSALIALVVVLQVRQLWSTLSKHATSPVTKQNLC